jgi:hypothetical protein
MMVPLPGPNLRLGKVRADMTYCGANDGLKMGDEDADNNYRETGFDLGQQFCLFELDHSAS